MSDPAKTTIREVYIMPARRALCSAGGDLDDRRATRRGEKGGYKNARGTMAYEWLVGVGYGG